jgi:hypothetical protein
MSVGDSTPRGGEVPHVEMRDFPTGSQGRPDEGPGRLGRRAQAAAEPPWRSAISRRIQRELEAAVLAAAARQSSLRNRLPARRPTR